MLIASVILCVHNYLNHTIGPTMQRKHINIGAIIIAFSYAIMSLAATKQKIILRAIESMITLQAANGQSKQIVESALKYSSVLLSAPRLQNHTIVVDACANEHELYALWRVLNSIDTAERSGWSRDKLMGELCDYATRNATFAAAIGNHFKIPLIKKAEIFAEKKSMAGHDARGGVGAKKAYLETLHTAFISGCDAYGHALTPLQTTGIACRFAYLQREEQKAKKQYLASKGAIRMPFFMGVSVGELIDNGLADIYYKHSIGRIVDAPHPCSLLNADITGIEGLRCEQTEEEVSDKERRVMITGTHIRTLPAKAFAHTNNPTWIMLNNNAIEEIDSEAFVGLEGVRQLDLAGNQLYKFPSNVFDSLKQLISLNISYNQLTTLDANLFTHCTNLLYLSLSGNTIPQHEIQVLRDKLPKVMINLQ